MSKNYFEKFPVIEYKGQVGINILKRVDVLSKVKDYYSNFYTYTMNRDETVDELAFNYYDTPELDWMIYQVNDVIDPYYDVNIREENFDKFIAKKYGSKRNAIRKTVHYKNNWESDDRILSVNEYQNLIAERKKYWKPVFSSFGLAGYERDREDYIASTNMIVSFDLTAKPEADFVKGEVVVINSDASNYGQVAWYGSNDDGVYSIVLQHVVGTFGQTSNYVINGETSDATATVDHSTYAKLQDVIPIEEQAYFKPVSAYDYEVSLNDIKRELYLVDNTHVERLNKELEKLLK